MADAKRDQNFVPTLLAVSSVDGTTPVPVYADPITHRLLVDLPSGSGTVTSVSVTSANGFAGTVATATTTPAITLSTTITGILKGNGTSISAAVSGTDIKTVNGTSLLGAGDVSVTASPGGSDTQVQYNNAGALAGITGATTNGTALTLVAPVLGTPASGTLTNCTGLPISTGVSGLGANVATFLATPSSANLRGALTDETGTGVAVFNDAPTFATSITTPAIRATANDSGSIGVSGTAFSDLFLADGGVINWNNGTATLANANTYRLEYTSTDASAGGAIFHFYANSASPAAADLIGAHYYYGNDSGATKTFYGSQALMMVDPTDTSEDSKFVWNVITAGTAANKLELTGAALYPTTTDTLALGTASLSFSDLFLAEGGVINWDNGDVTVTQTGNVLAVAGGDLRVATADVGTNADSVPTLSSTSTLSNKTLQHTVEPATDDTFTGETMTGLLAGDTIAQWDLVYLDSTSGRWEFTDADAATTAGSVGPVALASAAGTDGNALTVVLRGVVRNDGWTWTGAGKPLYVSTTAGAMTETAPSASADVVRVVGYTLSDDCIYFNPSNDWVVIT